MGGEVEWRQQGRTRRSKGKEGRGKEVGKDYHHRQVSVDKKSPKLVSYVEAGDWWR